jgi:hypothetical protein
MAQFQSKARSPVVAGYSPAQRLGRRLWPAAAQPNVRVSFSSIVYLPTSSPAELFGAGDRWMNMEQWWNDADRGKPTYLEKSLFHCQCVHHKSHKEGTSAVRRRHLNTEPWQGRAVMFCVLPQFLKRMSDRYFTQLAASPVRSTPTDVTWQKPQKKSHVINNYVWYDGSDCDFPRCDRVQFGKRYRQH